MFMENEEIKKETEMVTEEKPKETQEVTPDAVVSEETKEESGVSDDKAKALGMKEKLVKHWKLLTLGLVVLVLLLIGSLGRGLFVAAIVDGEPISRLSVIRELEKRSGGQALDTMVIKKIILKRALERGVSISSDDVDKEISTLEERMGKQGSTLEDALNQQGLTMDQFREQIILQKALEKILEDKLVATDDEVAKYLAQTKATAPTGMSQDEFKDKIKEQIKSQKFGTEVETWLTAEKQKANIRYYVDYALPAPDETTVPVESSQAQ